MSLRRGKRQSPSGWTGKGLRLNQSLMDELLLDVLWLVDVKKSEKNIGEP